MCGIAGFVDVRGRVPGHDLAEAVRDMADVLVHRGPDDVGVWCDTAHGAALGHRRLAVIDLSPAGHQPMVSASGRLVIAFNGEVYSHGEMRDELIREGVQFRGRSDTEVILEAFERWGVESTLSRMIGMFAIALWDRRDASLTLMRDRLGIKPLYWGWADGSLVFGSELKALTAFPRWNPQLNRDAVAAFLRHNYIPGPHSIYRDISKLSPGTYVICRSGEEPRHVRYWDLGAVVDNGLAARSGSCEEEMTESMHELLRDAVKRRMVSDVPLGALLSGGIDSSLVAALMQVQANGPIRTFSVGFREDAYNEAPYASKVAAHLGTEHTELYVEPRHSLDVIPTLAHWYDEPFADSSQIPTLLVCQLTRQHVTVALTGDGGDEVFAGYNRYLYGRDIWNRLSVVPLPVRKILARMARSTPEVLLNTMAKAIPARHRPAQFGYKVHKVASNASWSDPDALYRQLVTHWQEPDRIVLDSVEPKGILWDTSCKDMIPDFVERMQFFDSLTYLPDDILTKVDRASMAFALEARVPLLDHRVMELAWSLPRSCKLQGNRGKLLLRRLLARYLPNDLIERPKMGFGVPIDQWLRGPLRDWAESLLDRHRMDHQGLLDPEPIRAAWRAHLAGDNWAYPLWDVLMLQAWLDQHRWSG